MLGMNVVQLGDSMLVHEPRAARGARAVFMRGSSKGDLLQVQYKQIRPLAPSRWLRTTLD